MRVEAAYAEDPSPDVSVIVNLLNTNPATKLKGSKKYQSQPNGKGEGHFKVFFNPVVDNDYTSGGNENQPLEYTNLEPEDLQDELDLAERLGVFPISPSNSAKFDKIIEEGIIKWVVNRNGELKVMEHNKFDYELKHSVLSGGDPVLAAGEAIIGGNMKDGYYILSFTNDSGHFRPPKSSLEIGKTKFKEIINIKNDF